MIRGGKAVGAAVNMGTPVVEPPVPLVIGGEGYTAVPVSMGNPHAVVEVEDPAALDLRALGPAVERDPAFRHRVNAEFVRVLGRDRLEMRVWERGQRGDPGLRHRGLRERVGHGVAGEAGPGSGGLSGRGRAGGPLGRELRACVHDRPRRDGVPWRT